MRVRCKVREVMSKGRDVSKVENKIEKMYKDKKQAGPIENWLW